MLYVLEDAWNTICTVVVDGYIIRPDFINRRNVSSICEKSYPPELKKQAHLHHIRFNPANPAGNTVEVCDDPANSSHNRLYSGMLRK